MMGLGPTGEEMESQAHQSQTPATPPPQHQTIVQQYPGTPTSTLHSQHRPGSTLAAIAAARSAVAGIPGKNGLLNTFEPYSGFLNPGRNSPINCTSFHPHRMMVAAAAGGDTHINIFACSKGKGRDDGEEGEEGRGTAGSLRGGMR